MNSVHVVIVSFFVLLYKTCRSSSPQIVGVPFADGEDPDPDTPLFLTSLIENGKIYETRTKAVVRHQQMGNVESYSGYLTVNKEYNSNLFVWFFLSKITSHMAPVVLWLQGIPGLTSMFGLFAEHGPFSVTSNLTLIMRHYTWIWNQNVIYIDSPVGTGYSFTDDKKGYARNVTQVARDLYTALVQFFLLFPELQTNDFFVTGETYAGKYVVAVSHAIKNNNIKAETKINLKGLAIGNGLCDPENQLLYSDYLYQIGLIDLNGRTEFQKYEQAIREFIKQKNFVMAFEYYVKLFVNDESSHVLSLFSNLTGLSTYYNYINANVYDNSYYNLFRLLCLWIEKVDARYAIHVGNNTFNLYNSIVLGYQIEDLFESVVVLLIDLLEHYRVLIFNGQLDITYAYPLAANYLQKMQWPGAQKYAKAPRKLWKVGSDLAGFTKSADNLTFVLVRNAGNLVFIDQPIWTLELINLFTHDDEF